MSGALGRVAVRRLLGGLIVAGIAIPAVAAGPWTFSSPIPVTPVTSEKIFHHLESSGRGNIAVSGNVVAVAWEDNRDATPRVYVAFQSSGGTEFRHERRASGGAPAYEPVLAALGAGRFILGWEEDGAVWARTLSAKGLDPARRLSQGGASQIHIAVSATDEVQAVWAERIGGFTRIQTAELNPVPGKMIEAGVAAAVDPAPPRQDQQYPVVVWPRAGQRAVVWEDRRHGHTVLLWSHAPKGERFVPPRQLNETARQQTTYGAGSGVARPVIVGLAPGRLAAAWLDKRNFEGGYDVYAAFSDDDGRHFGKNQKVQDSFGDSYGQWHPAIAGNRAGLLAVVWDDDRDESADLWLAWPQGPGWSENQAVPGASGTGQQRSPVAALDEAGNLHLAWVEQVSAGTRLLYAFARRVLPKEPR